MIDENFRLLFLALMEDLLPSPSGDRVLPSVGEWPKAWTTPLPG